jgi:hypothetical protein
MILPNMINWVSEDSRECGEFFETKFVLIGQDWRKLELCEWGLFALFPRSHFSRNINIAELINFAVLLYWLSIMEWEQMQIIV